MFKKLLENDYTTENLKRLKEIEKEEELLEDKLLELKNEKSSLFKYKYPNKRLLEKYIFLIPTILIILMLVYIKHENITAFHLNILYIWLIISLIIPIISTIILLYRYFKK